MRHRQKINRLTVQALEAMTDEQLQAIADTDPRDLSGLTDAELEAVKHGTAGPGLLARIDKLKKATPA